MSQAAPPAELLLGRPEFSRTSNTNDNDDDDTTTTTTTTNNNDENAAAFVHDRRVLVTGAAGSIGWPLTQTLLSAAPARLILLDHHEHSLFSLERSLGQHPSVVFELADVRDESRLRRIFDRQQPEIVIHLAAAKHVPYGERFPEGAVAANVLATDTILRLSHSAGVEALVYPSSDKSVQPPSVYGATKRIAEALLQAAALQRRWAVVRYVNVIGTRGSVIETFTQQIQADRPLSVTDLRMTRYWISMDEAIWCALMAAQCAAPGEVVMPACGEPVPIVVTARRLAGWYRPQQVVYPITCTGIRPGERLHEVLLSPNESFANGPVAGMRPVRTTRDVASLSQLPRIMDELSRLVERGDREGLARTCLAAADALQ